MNKVQITALAAWAVGNFFKEMESKEGVEDWKGTFPDIAEVFDEIHAALEGKEDENSEHKEN